MQYIQMSLTRFLLVLLLLTTHCFSYQAPQDYKVIEDKAKLPILTPSLAEIKTAKIKLNNGLQAFLISDPHVEKSSAALTVRVGSWSDPAKYPGIAHFLEHMLFLGNKKYPLESEYNRYISEHGGLTNAFTSSDFTSYLFSIDNSAFEAGLDRFSNFFKEPLFNPSGVARELQAIDQEYAKNKENDDVRQLYVYKEIANPKHPFHQFNAGNSSTLAKVSQETLKEWYQANYGAALMRLVVISPLPIEKLIKIVVADFKDVPTGNQTPLNLEMPIFSSDLDGKMVYIEPVKNIRTLTLAWDLPAKFSRMERSKPGLILCYVLGSEGKESLLAALKKEHLAEKFNCGSVKLGPNNTQLYLEATLTDYGVKNVNTVIEKIFQAIANFKQKGVPEYLYNDVKRMAVMRYQYQQREEAFQSIMQHAVQLGHEDIDTYPEISNVIQEFDPKAVAELIDYLTPQNANYNILAPSSLTNVTPDRTEKWNDVGYSIKSIPPEVLEEWKQVKPSPGIDLPPPNPYIPESLDLVNIQLKDQAKASILPHPETIINNEKGKIYYSADKQFLTPQVGWIIHVRTPSVNSGNATLTAMADLFIRSAKDALDEDNYAASQADLNYDIKRNDNGLSIEINGYSDKAFLLLKAILKQLKEVKPTIEQFKDYKASQARDYQNFTFEQPLKQASDKIKTVLYKNYASPGQRLAAVRKITYAQFMDYIDTLFNTIYIEAMLYGNLTERQAQDISTLLFQTFDSAVYPAEDRLKKEVIVLPKDEGPFYLEDKVKVQGNAAVLVVQNPQFSFKDRAAQQVIMQAMIEPFFDELRTKQQTGYLVYNAGEEVERRLLDFFAVQSNSHDPRDLLARFELFIERYLQEITTELPEERYNKIRNALITNLKTPAQNVTDMAEFLDNLAFKYDGDFDWLDKRIAGLQELSYDEFLSKTKNFLGRGNKRRFAILLKGILPDSNIFQYQRLNSLQQLRNVGEYETYKTN